MHNAILVSNYVKCDDCELDTLEDPAQGDCSPRAYCRIRLSVVVRVDISVVRNVLVPIENLGDNLSPVLGAETGNGNGNTTGSWNNNNCSCH